MSFYSVHFSCLLFFFGLVTTVCGSDPAPDDKQTLQFFETKVRPLLAEHCFQCHGTKKQNGGLRLDSRAAILAGGEAGPAIIPHDPAESLLIEAIHYESLEMPPDQKLSSGQIQILTEWVQSGAPWPGSSEVALVPRQHGLEITAEDRNFWAFRPIVRHPVPNVPDATWDDQAIDGFIYRRLLSEGLNPSPQATPRELIRRMYFNLLGLPPTPHEVTQFEEAFVRNPLSSLGELVKTLLASQHYGERWGRHWLDVVRFAQTDGYERDGEKEFSWRYRDYVIQAFNADKPYDQFILEQLAGDELPEVTFDSVIATGFYRIGVWDDEPDVKAAAIYDNLDDIIRTTSEAFLGLTIGCARCHDHKFDPLPQADYYRLQAFFRNITPVGTDQSETHWKTNPAAIYTPLIDQQVIRQWEVTQGELQSQLAQLQARQENADEEAKKQLDEQITEIETKLKSPSYPQALSVREKGPHVEDTFILVRGNHLTKGKQVEPQFLSVLGSEKANIQPISSGGDYRDLLRNQGVQPTSGRRLALAQWIASPDNPMTARVLVNRIWHFHFGHGIVSTPSDFGRTGQPPSHPELLDWLASELIDHNWSIKHIHRLILQSNTYRQSSRQSLDDHHSQTKDPGNTLLWRQHLRRLDAESIRDAILSVSGKLNPEMGGRGIFPKLSTGVLASQSRPGNGWVQDQSEMQRARRSVYIFSKRTLGVPLMESLDAPTPDKPEPSRQTTTIAPQALILLNSEFMDWQTQAFAKRIAAEVGGDFSNRLSRAYRLAFGRYPTEQETAISSEFIKRQESQWASLESLNKDEVGDRAFIEFCRILFNMNEFIYID